jgi:hypothetical protein
MFHVAIAPIVAMTVPIAAPIRECFIGLLGASRAVNVTAQNAIERAVGCGYCEESIAHDFAQ